MLPFSAVTELNKRYKLCCRLCQEARAKCDMKKIKQRSFKSADRLLFYYAVHEVCNQHAFIQYKADI